MKKSIKLLTALSLTVPFLMTANAEQWDKNITTKIDVASFWNQEKETREIKYGKDPSSDTDFSGHLGFAYDFINGFSVTSDLFSVNLKVFFETFTS